MSPLSPSLWTLLWTLSFCVPVSSPEVVRLTAELGDDVTLKCNVTNKGNIVVVEWTRPDLDPEYVFLYRDGRSDPDEQNPSFKDRVKFKTDISDGDVSLILENVKTTDSGSYQCRVVQEGTNSRKEKSILKNGLIRTINLKVVQKVVRLTAELGDDVTLKCNVTNKGNIIVVEWTRPDLHPEYVFLYRDGRSYPDKQNPSFKERVKLEKTDIRDGDVSLILENVKTTDSGTYECRVFQRGTNSKKKRNTDSIRTIKLKVYQKGEKEEGGHEEGGHEEGGHEEGGHEEGGHEEGGHEEGGHRALHLGLMLSAAVLVSTVVGVVMFRKRSPYRPAAKEPSGPGRPGGPEQV
ncbi:coxsackievirus and adenovirus receptor homolog [Echeneis naucrates]|uniref:coxsackievirus and adenovirus receptor homolog n=1 Tax=Echeneis naucrates TaxID=173247 RepID=UPI0011135012|nr:coxsackievirus and adenovirus receptor homolog [Echeneis naucrates]